LMVVGCVAPRGWSAVRRGGERRRVVSGRFVLCVTYTTRLAVLLVLVRATPFMPRERVCRAGPPSAT